MGMMSTAKGFIEHKNNQPVVEVMVVAGCGNDYHSERCQGAEKATINRQCRDGDWGGAHSTNTADCIAMQCRVVARTTSKWPTGEQEKTISQR